MSPFNLEDIEEYLVKQAKGMATLDPNENMDITLIKWIRKRFAELRLKEKSILNNA